MLDPANSLVNQSHDPELHPHLQLAGWGFGVWGEHLLEPEKPLIYKRAVPAFSDDNANSVIPSLQAHSMIAQVRASGYHSGISQCYENCHPFSFEGTPWLLAHNGAVPNWRVLQRELLKHCKDEFLRQIKGSTDTEFFYVLVLSLLEGDGPDDFQSAFCRALKLIVEAMKTVDMVHLVKLKITLVSPHKIIVANYGSGPDGDLNPKGDWKAMRKAKVGSTEHSMSMVLEPLYLLFGKDFVEHEGSFKMDLCSDGKATSAIVASEPLTENREDWLTIEFGQMMALKIEDGILSHESRSLQT